MTNKQRAFINHYLQCWNATEAAKRAGYSERTAYSIGHENLIKPEIAKEIEKQLTSMRMSANEVLHRLSQIARNEVASFITGYGGIVAVDMNAIREAGLMHLVQEVRNSRAGPRIKFTDSQRALETLAKVHSLLVERVKIDDWHTQAIADIKAGNIRYEDLASAFDTDLATQLFARAGIPVQTSEDS